MPGFTFLSNASQGMLLLWGWVLVMPLHTVSEPAKSVLSMAGAYCGIAEGPLERASSSWSSMLPWSWVVSFPTCKEGRTLGRAMGKLAEHQREFCFAVRSFWSLLGHQRCWMESEVESPCQWCHLEDAHPAPVYM